MQLAPMANSGIRGMLVNTRMQRNPAATAKACGREKSCLRNSAGRSVSVLLRVTSKPAAKEMRKAGTCVTRPSPMVSVVKTDAAWPGLMPASITPMNSPPTMLIKVMMMPATASPRTNLLAPSIAPKKSACWRDLAAAALGLALVDRARVQVGVDGHLPAGHAVQGEAGGDFADPRRPLVMTTNWMMTMIAKMIKPTTILPLPAAPPVTNSPNVFTTPPAANSPSDPPLVRINRVVATFSTRRNRVVANSSEGKMLNSSGVRT